MLLSVVNLSEQLNSFKYIDALYKVVPDILVEQGKAKNLD